MPNTITGTAHSYAIDNIDTDRIIPGKYTKTLDMSELASHVLEDLDPTFSKNVRAGDVLVAGGNFGCGSSREQAPIALKAAGVSAVVAKSFAVRADRALSETTPFIIANKLLTRWPIK